MTRYDIRINYVHSLFYCNTLHPMDAWEYHGHYSYYDHSVMYHEIKKMIEELERHNADLDRFFAREPRGDVPRRDDKETHRKMRR